jgi:hypothetical protein
MAYRGNIVCSCIAEPVRLNLVLAVLPRPWTAAAQVAPRDRPNWNVAAPRLSCSGDCSRSLLTDGRRARWRASAPGPRADPEGRSGTLQSGRSHEVLQTLMQTWISVEKEKYEVQRVRNAVCNDRHGEIAAQLQVQCSQNEPV